MKEYILLLITAMFVLASCQKRTGVLGYDIEKTFIYFKKPKFNLGSAVDLMDSLTFSFAFEADDLKEKTLSFPVQIIGQKQGYDRAIGFKIIKDQTTVPDSLIQVVPPVMRADHFQDTLFIRVKRNAFLKKQSYILKGELYQNETFAIGSPVNTKFTLVITDQLIEPSWWFSWQEVFGSYRKEVYKKWIELYPPGIDKTPPLLPGDKPNFAWNNMPVLVQPYYYPVTFFYIEQLRQYFEEHIVYPDGNSSKPRIYIPY